MKEIQSKPSPYRWWLIAMLWCVCFCNYADRQAIFSIFPLLHTELKLNDLELGVVASSFMWMYAVAGPFAGWISDRISPRSVILGALAFWSLVTAGTAISHSFSVLVWFRTLGGLGEAFYFPAAMALIGLYHGSATRSRAMALHQSSVYAGTIAGGSMSAVIAEQHGWRVSFLIFGTVGLFLCLVLIFCLRSPEHPQQILQAKEGSRFLQGVSGVLRSSKVLVLIGVFIGANFVAVVFLTWLPTFLFNKFHLSLSQAGFSSTAYLQIASVLGVLLGGLLADRVAAKRIGGRQLIQASGLLFGVPFIFLTGWSPTMFGLVVGMIGFGFFKGMYDANIWASLYDVIPVERRGVAAGTMNSLGWLGGGIAPIAIAAASRRFGLSACISATSLIYLALAFALILLARSMRQHPALTEKTEVIG
jgi:MFS family permease